MRTTSAAVARSTVRAAASDVVTASPDGAAVLSGKSAILTEDGSLDSPKVALGIGAGAPLPYDWRERWYAVCFEENAPVAGARKPMSVSVFDEPLVLFRDQSGGLRCLEDRCAHRSAKLSEGQVLEGRIECFYHGWQFEGCGRCGHIPQLAGEPPKAANLRSYPVEVREGIVWVYMGNAEKSVRKAPPVSADDTDVNTNFDMYSFQIDLPYDNTFLAENLLDPAHIPVSHDATPGGGKKANAQPLEMEVLETSSDGVKGRFRNTRGRSLGGVDSPSWTNLDLEAPGIVRYRGEPKPGFIFGAALHCMPLGLGRSRLLFRIYSRLPWKLRLISKLMNAKPLFLRHLSSCVILEQDVGLITSQEDRIARTGRSPQADWLPLKTSDTMLVAYRRWLDRVGHGMPHFLGWKHASPGIFTAATGGGSGRKVSDSGSGSSDAAADHPIDSEHRALRSRFDRHVLHCAVCKRALRMTRLAKTSFGLLAVVGGMLVIAAALAAPPATWPRQRAVACALLGLGVPLGGRAAAARLERAFYSNYKRHPELA